MTVKSNIQEDEFIEAIETLAPQVSLINLSKETELLVKARESLSYFIKCYSVSSFPFKKLYVDWEQVATNVIRLARIFHVRGYLNDRRKAMELLFDIAELSQDSVALIQAFSFFLETTFSHAGQFEEKIIKKMSMVHDILFDKYSNLECLKSPRTENNVLLCLLNLAYYYYLSDNNDMAFSLLEIVKDAIDYKLPNQIGRNNVIRMYLHLIQYRILAKEKDYSLEGASALHREVEEIWNCFKSHVYVSSEDSMIYPAIQYDVVNELFVYHSLRLTTNKMVPYVRLMLNQGLANGCALRIIQMASIYSHVQYQSECMTKFLVSLVSKFY